MRIISWHFYLEEKLGEYLSKLFTIGKLVPLLVRKFLRFLLHLGESFKLIWVIEVVKLLFICLSQVFTGLLLPLLNKK
jgi:hypothetical protein